MLSETGGIKGKTVIQFLSACLIGVVIALIVKYYKRKRKHDRKSKHERKQDRN